MEKQEIIMIIAALVAIIGLLIYTSCYWKNEYEELRSEVRLPSQIPTSPNPPPPPRTFIERNPYSCSEKRVKALKALIFMMSQLQKIPTCEHRDHIQKKLLSEIDLIEKAQSLIDVNKD
ncbi:hypothetical protein AACH28_04775 [Sphingobacterium thalpophilum]|uniref:Uncharacterized protein n=1 Tax=Sphingobacterium thalpophilum TaxID=259 RepID=A0ACD5C4P0_9SPHI|nr:hypothetical protein [Sphingobacterium multivorum]